MTGRLDVEGVSLRHGAKEALSDVTFTAAPGFTALLGANGAGKTSLVSVVTGLLAPHAGRVAVAGRDVGREREPALAKLGVVFQSTTLDLDLSVIENLLYFAGLHGLSRREGRRRADLCLARLGMGERARERVRALNGGHRRRVEIARALLHEPAVLVCDEPTVGLDVATRARIVADVHALARAGTCVLWATHLIDEVGPDDAVVLIENGCVAARGRAGALGDLRARLAPHGRLGAA